MMKHKYRLIWVIIWLSSLVLQWADGDETFDEYGVKSTFLYQVCIFTRWPVLPPPDQPFVISIIGTLPRGEQLYFPGDVTIHQRRVILRPIQRLAQIDKSMVLFITSSEAHRIQDILDYTSGKPILTVGDTSGFAQKGVIINFFIRKGNRVGFEINHEASKRASLKMHSQLFTVGKVVNSQPPLPPKDNKNDRKRITTNEK